MDNVNHPSHYLANSLVIEPIELTGRLDSCLGQACQYVIRAKDKGSYEEDLAKAVFFLKKELSLKGSNAYVFDADVETGDVIRVYKRFYKDGVFKSFLNALFPSENLYAEAVTKDSLFNAIQLLEGELCR